MTVLRVLLLLFAGCCAACARADERASPRTLEVDGVQRRFNLLLPEGARPAPLIITLHGHGQSAREVERLSGWNEVAATEGAVVAYPAARGVNWRIFGPSSPDVAFLLALIDELADAGLVDADRVFVNGYSGGAQMAWRLACEAPARVAALGFVAGAAPDACGVGAKPPLIMFHGEADRSLPYRNATGTLAIPALGRAWAERPGCVPEETTGFLADTGQRAEGVLRHRWCCEAAAPVELYSFKRGGHHWPGRSRAAGSRSLDATRVMWEFFRKHVMGSADRSCSI